MGGVKFSPPDVKIQFFSRRLNIQNIIRFEIKLLITSMLIHYNGF